MTTSASYRPSGCVLTIDDIDDLPDESRTKKTLLTDSSFPFLCGRVHLSSSAEAWAF
ncbi:MAG: hypothetical protein NZ585_03320 [Chloracidobacterium sp.]|nr:hypothetical protein [Chloracidobacterium sp.]